MHFIAAAMLIAASLASAQNYPAKPIRFVVPYAPGGASDVTARLIGQKMTEPWGQTVAALGVRINQYFLKLPQSSSVNFCILA